MSTEPRPVITVETTVVVPVQRAWLLWTDPRHITKWNQASDDWHTPRAENDVREGGHFLIRMEAKDGSMGFDFEGVYEVVVRNERVEYRIGDGRKVAVRFIANGEATTVTETFEAESTHPVEMQRDGWQSILESYRKYAASRPRLTIPQVVETKSELAAVVHVVTPRDQIKEAMRPAVDEVIAAVMGQGIGPVGPMFSRHFEMKPDVFDFEVGFPVSAPVAPVGRVQSGELPAAKVVRAIYQGPYESLGEAWGEFLELVASAGHVKTTGLWERYLTNPMETPNPEDHQTELNQPIVQTAP
jgi:uncharacterized protein YndB with AHSA1/START domain/effector-binding domain-containing protein